MNEIARLETRATLAAMPRGHLAALAARARWKRESRPNQFAPQFRPNGPWSIWCLNCGRGWGKTRTETEWAWWQAWRTPNSIVHAVARTSSDVGGVLFEGPAGFEKVVPPEIIANYTRGPYEMTLTNGAKIKGFTAEKPAVLRGPQCHYAIGDEIAHWQYPEQALSNLFFGLRLRAENGRATAKAMLGSTPLPKPHIKELLARAKDLTDSVALSIGSTYENETNLEGFALQELRRKYEGTRLGRQELRAELLEDTPGALWTWETLNDCYLAEAPDAARIVVAVDPPAATAECGIVVAQRDQAQRDGLTRGTVLEDASLEGSPAKWGRAVVEAHDRWKADAVVVETNQGGQMVIHTVKMAAQEMRQKGLRDSNEIKVIGVHASRGKLSRGEPVAALYEQGRVKHLGAWTKLEEQMTGWTPDSGLPSPDRMDALVWALTEVMLQARVMTGPRLSFGDVGVRPSPVRIS
jgi:phage terminase large subunit-like protein